MVQLARDQSLFPIACLGHHLDVCLRLQDHSEASTNKGLVIGNHGLHAVCAPADARSKGNHARTLNPRSTPGPTSRRPPTKPTRSFMPAMPRPDEPLPVAGPSHKTSIITS